MDVNPAVWHETPATPGGEARATPGRPAGCRRAVVAAGTLGLTAALVAGLGTAGVATRPAPTAQVAPWTPSAGSGEWPSGSGREPGSGAAGGGSASGGRSSTATPATPDQQLGVVDITTVLGHATGEAAGTGMVLSSSGEILTNNHVIEGATSVTVTVVSTGTSYTATVVGTDPTDDVAVLQLRGASGLQVADFSRQAAAVGDAVTAVGNAGGAGGTPSAVSGTITAVGRSITATDWTGGNAERLTGLLETSADVQAGDSGGPLYDTASGQIVGMDTAASDASDVVGYAIPVSHALSIARQIVAGVDTATIHQGYPAFLGVSVSPSRSGGSAIAGVLSGRPAEQAGLAAGDVITGVDATTIASAPDLTTALTGHDPGDAVPVTWTDSAGATHTAQVTLAAGPAD